MSYVAWPHLFDVSDDSSAKDGQQRDEPFVGIERVEVHSVRAVFATSEIVLQHRAESGDICCGVADWDLAIILFYERSALLIQRCQMFATHHRGTPSCHEQQL